MAAGQRHERHLQAAVEEHLRATGWRYYHVHNAQHSVAGFPDIVALRGERIFVAETGGPKTRVTSEQRVAVGVRVGGRPRFL